MATSKLGEVIQHLRRIVLLRDGAGMTDGQLLEHFVSHREGAALEAIVKRHGRMVWGVCYRLLRNNHDAEDAFQATFLVLVRKAVSLVPKEMVGNWLYGVAHQTALNVRANCRRIKEKQVTDMPEPEAPKDNLWHELQPILDQELSRLPDKYRAVIVLCDLEGKTRKEAARQLGAPEGTVGGQLARARTMLAKRLARHGIGASGGALAAVISQNAVSACVPPLVVSSTIKAVSLVAAGKVATGVISANVLAITEGAVKTMLLTKLKTMAAVSLMVCVLGTGVGVATFPKGTAGQKETHKGGPTELLRFQARAAQLPTDSKEKVDNSSYLVKVPSPLDGSVQFIGTEIKEGEKVLPEKVITVQTGGEMKKFRRLEKGDRVEEGQLLVRLDAGKALEDLAIKERNVAASRVFSNLAKAIALEADEKLKTAKLLHKRNALATEELLSAELTRDKMDFDFISKMERTKLAEAEVRLIQTLIELHEIRSKVSGVIAKIRKQTGDKVKRSDTVLEIEITEKERNTQPRKNVDKSISLVKVASKIGGVVQFIGMEIKEGEKVPPGRVITVQMDGERKRFRRLTTGDSVEQGQLLAQLDDRLVRAELSIKESEMILSKADRNAAKVIADEAEMKLSLANRLNSIKAISAEDLRSAKMTRDKMVSDFEAKEEGAKLAVIEGNMVRIHINQHEIRSHVSGVLGTIHKRPGEAVSEGETVFEIEVTKKEK